MDTHLRIIFPCDVFPPGSVGGAAWSSLALARALRDRGHSVTVIVAQRGKRGSRRRDQDCLSVVEVGYRAPNLPFIQNFFRFERLWPLLAGQIARVAQEQVTSGLPLVIHGQHAQSIP